jgi:hypothetical protein
MIRVAEQEVPLEFVSITSAFSIIVEGSTIILYTAIPCP